MPRLPRTPLYEVQSAQNNTRVTPIQRVSGEDAVGAALGNAGDAAFEIGSRLREAQITNEVAKAHNDLNLKLDAEYRQLEKDTGDPTELEAKWQARSKEILAETSGGMTSPMHRRLFDAQAAQLAEGYQIKTRDLTRKKQVQGAVADTYRLLDDLAETAADPEIDLEVLQRNTDNTLSLARKKYSLGILNEEQLAEIEVKAGDQLEIGTSMRNVATINRLLDTGYIDEARDRMASQKNDKGEEQNAFRLGILPEQRAKLDEVLKVKAQAADAFSKADQLMAESGGDYGKAISGAREIQDPELRQNVESRLTTMKEQDNAAKSLRQKDVQNAGMEILLTGKGISSIPTDVYADADAKTKEYWQDYVFQQRQREQSMRTLSAQERAALREEQSYVKASIKGVAATDVDLYLEGPPAWKSARPDMYDAFLKLPQSDQQEVLNDISKRSGTGQTVTKADAVYKALLAEATRSIPEMGKSSNESKKWYVELTGRLRAAAEKEAAELGDVGISVDRTRQIVGKEAGEVTRKKGGFLGMGGKQESILLADPEVLAAGNAEERRRRALQIAADPELGIWYSVARENLMAQGRKPSEYEIASEALRLKEVSDLRDGRQELMTGLPNMAEDAGSMIDRMLGRN